MNFLVTFFKKKKPIKKFTTCNSANLQTELNLFV